jgi:hypothetical protein
MYMGEATYSRWQGEAGPIGAWLIPSTASRHYSYTGE